MAEDTTKSMNGNRNFEERVFARFDALDSRLGGLDAKVNVLDAKVTGLEARLDEGLVTLDSRLLKLEAKSYDTKPIWEQALKEILETRRELSKRLDRIEACT